MRIVITRTSMCIYKHKVENKEEKIRVRNVIYRLSKFFCTLNLLVAAHPTINIKYTVYDFCNICIECNIATAEG